MKAVELFGDKSDVLIGQHHWPTWGNENIAAFLTKQRDLHKYIHDQSLRLMSYGYRPAEIAEVLDLPPDLAREWSVRGYYGYTEPQCEGRLSPVSELVRRQPRQSQSAATERDGGKER